MLICAKRENFSLLNSDIKKSEKKRFPSIRPPPQQPEQGTEKFSINSNQQLFAPAKGAKKVFPLPKVPLLLLLRCERSRSSKCEPVCAEAKKKGGKKSEAKKGKR
jgi:hypothetical protein